LDRTQSTLNLLESEVGAALHDGAEVLEPGELLLADTGTFEHRTPPKRAQECLLGVAGTLEREFAGDGSEGNALRPRLEYSVVELQCPSHDYSIHLQKYHAVKSSVVSGSYRR
jgi:hypothetical protein